MRKAPLSAGLGALWECIWRLGHMLILMTVTGFGHFLASWKRIFLTFLGSVFDMASQGGPRVPKGYPGRSKKGSQEVPGWPNVYPGGAKRIPQGPKGYPRVPKGTPGVYKGAKRAPGKVILEGKGGIPKVFPPYMRKVPSSTASGAVWDPLPRFGRL